ncbi:MAG: potassium-transporting ATPase subunit KdpA [Betaproteobacteria bacterium]|nr:potassium-transporting ATPase subunit KdpA [Betaproteobacteria bacterium]
MTPNGFLQIGIFIGLLVLLAKPVGSYMARIYEGDLPIFVRWLAPVERLLYRVCGISPEDEMRWTRYAGAMTWFALLSVIAVYALQRLQGHLPLNPQHFGAVSPDSSFNTAISFMTNTNWQGYAGESTMSDLTQMLGLAVQNFLSAAAGMAVAIALIRGFARRTAETIGNFWVDVTRSVLYILLPMSLALAVALVGQGVIQTFSPYRAVALTEPVTYDQPQVGAAGAPRIDRVTTDTQTIAMGPVASQEAIKELGTNGGGFFNANSAHPFENPTPLSNFLEMAAILLIPVALTYTFGKMVGDTRQGWAILGAMALLFAVGLATAEHYEQVGNPAFTALGVDQSASSLQPGGNMEGKEARFGIVDSALWATVTTATSCGAVNSMHDSYTPLGGLVPMALMQLGEVVFGGVGSGLFGMLIYAVIAVFIAGLMIGRTPEYLGKKIEAFDIKMASLVILIPPLLILGLTALAVLLRSGQAGPLNPGPHGFSEILYAFSEGAANNGSAFAGLSANTPFYNLTIGLDMFFGRIWLMVPVLALAGSLAAKKRVPPGVGTMATHTPLFIGLLVGTVILVGALTFVPADSLGPIVEQLNMIGAH